MTGMTERRGIRTRAKSERAGSAFNSARVTGRARRAGDDVHHAGLPRPVRGVRVGIAGSGCGADDGLLVPRVIVEDSVALPHGTQVLLRQRVLHTAPGGAPVTLELVEAVVRGFFLEEPGRHVPLRSPHSAGYILHSTFHSRTARRDTSRRSAGAARRRALLEGDRAPALRRRRVDRAAESMSVLCATTMSSSGSTVMYCPPAPMPV